MPDAEMPIDEAIAVLRGTTRYPIVQDDMDRAVVALFRDRDALRAELDRYRAAGDELAAVASVITTYSPEARFNQLGLAAEAWRAVRGDAPTGFAVGDRVRVAAGDSIHGRYTTDALGTVRDPYRTRSVVELDGPGSRRVIVPNDALAPAPATAPTDGQARRVSLTEVRRTRRAWSLLPANERDRWSWDEDGFLATQLSGGVIPADFCDDPEDAAPAVDTARPPAVGDRIVDGGMTGVLVRCQVCDGDGALFEADPGQYPPPIAPSDPTARPGPDPEQAGGERR